MVSNLSHVLNQNYNSPLQNVLSSLYNLWYFRKTEPLDFTWSTTCVPLLCPLSTFYTTFCFCISFIELQNTFLSCLLHLPNAVDCWAYCKILLIVKGCSKSPTSPAMSLPWDYSRHCLAEPYGLKVHCCFEALAVLPDIFQYSFAWKESMFHAP